MKKIISAIICCVLVLLLSNCTSYKKVPYLQNSNDVVLKQMPLFDAKIMPKDILVITVNCSEEPKAASIFNLVVSSNNTSSNFGQMSSQSYLQQYIVSNEGDIEFPVLGKLHVAGMTKTQLEEYIFNRIYGTYMKAKPIVVVSMANYKFSVLGEVGSPGVYTVPNGKINVLEALAMAHDLTIYGRRDCVKIIRENSDGQKSIVEVDLNDANLINSPYYQLQQNDIIYVTPNKVKSKNSGIGSETSLWFTSVSIVISVASLLYNILR